MGVLGVCVLQLFSGAVNVPDRCYSSEDKEGMCHKMPLTKKYEKRKLLKNEHNHQIPDQIFTQFCKAIYFSHHAAALSSKCRVKNTLQEASYDTYPDTRGKIRSDGSMTLEMAVVLPLFVSFMVFFLFLFRILLVQESMEEALVYTSRTLAVTCFTECSEERKTQAGLLTEARIVLQKGLKESDCPIHFIRGGAAGVSLLSSELTGENIILRASYEMRLPCVLLGSYCFRFVQCAQSRKWIGNLSLEQSTGADDEWVYITPYGTVYHRDRTCRYLDLNIHAVNRRSLGTLRNANREIYRKCESCGDAGSKMVYVTDYGTRYHSSLACGGLKRTIYMVKLSQVGGKKSCSKCGVRQ